MDNTYKKTIRTHWKNTAVFTDNVNSLLLSRLSPIFSLDTVNGLCPPVFVAVIADYCPFLLHKLRPAKKLLSGEEEAYIFKVGCYTIRSAKRFYKSTDNNTDCKEPANEEDLSRMRVSGTFPPTLLRSHEIMARHNTDPGRVLVGGFKDVCCASHSSYFSWGETIKCICTVKENSRAPDNSARLFVLKRFIKSSYSVDTWYALDPDGEIEEYNLSPF